MDRLSHAGCSTGTSEVTLGAGGRGEGERGKREGGRGEGGMRGKGGKGKWRGKGEGEGRNERGVKREGGGGNEGGVKREGGGGNEGDNGAGGKGEKESGEGEKGREEGAGEEWGVRGKGEEEGGKGKGGMKRGGGRECGGKGRGIPWRSKASPLRHYTDTLTNANRMREWTKLWAWSKRPQPGGGVGRSTFAALFLSTLTSALGFRGLITQTAEAIIEFWIGRILGMSKEETKQARPEYCKNCREKRKTQ